MMPTRIILLLIGTLGLGAMAAGIALDRPQLPSRRIRTVTAPQGSMIAITNVRVFDGDRMLPRATVIIEGDHIGAVGAGVPVPASAMIVDGSGQTLLPGFIDAHTHARDDALERALVFGVTTELD